jgi:aminoglycoside 3'-phosphotransferase-2
MTASVDDALPDWAVSWVSSTVPEEVQSVTRVESNEVNRVFRLEFDRQTLYLKIGPDLQREYEKLQWLAGRLPCPRPVGLLPRGETDGLLTSAIEGDGLAGLCASLPPHIIVSRLVSALKTLHATPITDWPFGRANEGDVLLHGDACLPNFLFMGDLLSGYIDVGDMRVGAPEVDLAASVWSLQYNLGPGHGLAFLHAYGVQDADEERVEALRWRYEEG